MHPCQKPSNLDYLRFVFCLWQENSPKPELSLVAYLAKERSDCIQKILLCLAIDIHQVPTLEDKLKSLHHYATFANILVKELGVKGDGLGDMATFVIRDVSHTLIHLMKQSYQSKEFPLAVASCHFYRLFCSKCFPACSSVVETFLLVLVGILVPLAKLSGDLGAESRALLRFLVVENSEHLSSAIEILDPFPAGTVFEEMREVYTRIVQVKRMNTLEGSIRYFLKAGNKNLCCRAEGLKHLRIQVLLILTSVLLASLFLLVATLPKELGKSCKRRRGCFACLLLN
jgi:hypothetical protein